jgi:hypothetical protein
MKSNLLVIFSTFSTISALILCSSCEILQPLNVTQTTSKVLKNSSVCVWENALQANECDIKYWLRFWSDIEAVSWPERKKQIDALSEQDDDVLKKVLLSQGKSTPFQDRLRAQGWVELILPKLTQQMRRFILVSLYYPSQDLLEMESAMVTLSKINTHQSINIKEQQILLDKQKSQIDQLLNIEASIMQSSEEDK